MSALRQQPSTSYVMMEPTDPRAANFMHLGIMPNGAVAAIRNGNLLILSEGSWERAHRQSECLGWVWQKLPPATRPPHKVVATLGDGTPVSVALAEMVYNDAGLINKICGEGFYEKLMSGRPESDALEIAKRLYSQPNLVVVGARA